MAAIDTKPSRVLAALTTTALALPGLVASVQADTSPQNFSVDTNFSRYSESAGRMRVDAYQAVATLPINDKLSFRINGVKDVVTGASPVGPALNGVRSCKGPSQGSLTQCMSGASISDVRDAIDINASYYYTDAGTLDLDVGRSSENDYESNFFNLNNRWEFNNKMTTLATGYGYASDQVWEIKDINGVKVRTSGNGGDKETHQSLLGLTQILDKNSLIQTNLTYSFSDGYLSDPYKYAYAPWLPVTFSSNPYSRWEHDARPGFHNQIGLLARYVRNFENLNAGALHADYRFYSDTWGVDSHTFEISWLQPVLDGWLLTPRGRYYSQNSAFFYDTVFTSQRSDGFYSSDYRLAGFGAISGGVQLSKEFFNKLKVSGGVDFYERKMAYGFSGGVGSPLDNYTFSMFSVSLNLKF